jgi:hypothetical protein
MDGRRIILALSLLVGFACGRESSLVLDPLANRTVETAVDVTLDRQAYRAGDLIGVTLINNSSRDYGYNLCGRSFEKHDGSDWRAMPPELRLCTQELRGLPAGEWRTGQADLPTDFAAGTYRLLVYLVETSPGGTTSTIAISAPFTIQ